MVFCVLLWVCLGRGASYLVPLLYISAFSGLLGSELIWLEEEWPFRDARTWARMNNCEFAHLWVNRKESSLMWTIVTEMMVARKVETG